MLVNPLLKPTRTLTVHNDAGEETDRIAGKKKARLGEPRSKPPKEDGGVPIGR